MIHPHVLPTGSGDSIPTARRFVKALGPAYQAKPNTAILAEALTIGQALYDEGEASLTESLNQIFLATATDTLEQHEGALHVTTQPLLTDAERQDRLVRFSRAIASGNAPKAIELALSSLNAVVYETSITQALLEGDNRAVFHWGVTISPSFFANPQIKSDMKNILEIIKPTHTEVTLGNGYGFWTDGYNGSMTDSTLLGS